MIIIHLVGEVGAGKTFLRTNFMNITNIFDIKQIYKRLNFNPLNQDEGYQEFFDYIQLEVDRFLKIATKNQVKVVIFESSGTNQALNYALRNNPNYYRIWVNSGYNPKLSEYIEECDFDVLELNEYVMEMKKKNVIVYDYEYFPDKRQFSIDTPDIVKNLFDLKKNDKDLVNTSPLLQKNEKKKQKLTSKNSVLRSAEVSQLDLRNAIFLDADTTQNKLKMKNHIQGHKHAYIRKSSLGNIHVIVFDSCENCSRYSDKHFQGKILFNNKGENWAERKWKNVHTEKTIVFPSHTLIRLIRYEYDSYHEYDKPIKYYLLNPLKIDEYWSKINRRHLEYSFHCVISHDLNMEFVPLNDIQSDISGKISRIRKKKIGMQTFRSWDDLKRKYFEWVNKNYNYLKNFNCQSIIDSQVLKIILKIKTLKN